VERRLIVERERLIERDRFHGEFSRPGPFVPPPPGTFFVADGPCMPPMPAGMQPSWPPPAPLGSWEAFDHRRRAGFEQQPMLPNEARWSLLLPVPPPKPEHELELRDCSEVCAHKYWHLAICFDFARVRFLFFRIWRQRLLPSSY